MKVPSKVKIKRGVYYSVVWQEVIRDDVSCLGLCDPNERIIYLKLKMSNTDIAKTMIHEICHALTFECNFDLPHKTVYALEESIFKLLKLNRWL
jgi:hypothetical protein